MKFGKHQRFPLRFDSKSNIRRLHQASLNEVSLTKAKTQADVLHLVSPFKSDAFCSCGIVFACLYFNYVVLMPSRLTFNSFEKDEN